MFQLQPKTEAIGHRMQMRSVFLQRPPTSGRPQLRVQPQEPGKGEADEAGGEG